MLYRDYIGITFLTSRNKLSSNYNQKYMHLPQAETQKGGWGTGLRHRCPAFAKVGPSGSVLVWGEGSPFNLMIHAM